MSEALASDVTIPMALTADTAETGDYGLLASITIPGGTTSGTGTVTTAQDTDTDDERFTVALGSLPAPVRAGSPSSVAVTITDDDEPPPPAVTLSVAPNPVMEGTPVMVTARLSGALAGDVTIPMALTADTAETGDYGPLASITIPGGTTSGTGTVTTAQDADTDDERFTVALGSSLPATVRAGSPSSVAVMITDDDEPPPPKMPPQTLTLRVAPTSAPVEGGEPVTVTAMLDAPALTGGTTVTLALSGTATAGASGDYTMSSRTIEIAEGATAGTATLRVIDDAEDEDDETVVIDAVGANLELAAPPLTLTIADNDEAGVTVSRAALSVLEGATATYTVELDSKPMAEVVISATSGTPAKATVSPVSVTFTPDDWDEAKTITVAGVEAGSSTIMHGASSTDGKYGGSLSISSVAVTVTAVQKRVVKPVWLARFGRTVTWQVLEAVEERLTAPREAGAQATLAGYELAEWTPGTVAASDHEWADAGGESGLAWDASGRSEQTRTVTEQELLQGSSFVLTGGADAGGGQAGLWGRGAHGRFDGREGELVLDGEVTAGLVGADWASVPGLGAEAGGWSAGVAVGHARGAGGYRSTSHGRGAVEAALTGFYPYAGYELTDWLTAWATAGYGAGDVTVKERGRTALQADLTLAMGAAGLRSEVVRPPADGEGLSLAVTGDARYTHTSSEAAHTSDGNLAALEAGTWLARAGVEGERRFGLGGAGAWLTPSIEVGARVDGGDAEKGIGADLGGGLAFAAPASGLSVDLKARVLVAHECVVPGMGRIGGAGIRSAAGNGARTVGGVEAELGRRARGRHGSAADARGARGGGRERSWRGVLGRRRRGPPGGRGWLRTGGARRRIHRDAEHRHRPVGRGCAGLAHRVAADDGGAGGRRHRGTSGRHLERGGEQRRGKRERRAAAEHDPLVVRAHPDAPPAAP